VRTSKRSDTNPFGAEVSPDGSRIYLTDIIGNTASVIDIGA
jgi:DNA-binding beta-propeller fold protein YncE